MAASTVATAHPQFGPAAINRYGRLVLTSPGRARLFYTVMVGDIPALRLRQSVDADHSGQLDGDEQAALQAKIAALVQQGLLLQAGPNRVPLTWESAQLALGDTAVSARAFSFDAMAVTQPLSAQTSEIVWRYQDQALLSPAGEVELCIEEAPGVWLRGSRGPAPMTPRASRESPAKAAPTRLFQMYGPAETHSPLIVELDVAAPVHARSQSVATPGQSGPALRGWLTALALLLLGALAAAGWATRRSA